MTENPTPVILTELTADGVMLLTLNRPERHNAWTLEMELLYNELFDRAEQDPGYGPWCSPAPGAVSVRGWT